MLLSVLEFIFGFLLSLLVICIFMIIGLPSIQRRNKISENLVLSEDVEKEEDTQWVNQLLDAVFKNSKIDISNIVKEGLQNLFDNSCKENEYIKKVEIVNVEMPKESPYFQNAKTIENTDGDASFLLGITYKPEIHIFINISVTCKLVDITIPIFVKISQIDGFVELSIPFEKGPFTFKLVDGTQINISACFGENGYGISANIFNYLCKTCESFIIWAIKDFPFIYAFPWENIQFREAEDPTREMVGNLNQLKEIAEKICGYVIRN